MSNSYEAPDPEDAASVHRTSIEFDRQSQRLEHASADELKVVVRNRAESNAARRTALLGLMVARDPELTDLVLELFDDPDQELWRTAIVGARLTDPRIRAKLQNLLDDPDDANWSKAAVTLARAGEVGLLPRFVAWLEVGDEPHRNVAVECLKSLKNPSARLALENRWESGEGDDEIRLVVAAALLDFGDQRGRGLLDSVARSGDGSGSVFAATSIYITQPRDGLTHMLHILDNGSLEAKQDMVCQIWNFAHLPHAFTADGLAEARVWVEEQLRHPQFPPSGLG